MKEDFGLNGYIFRVAGLVIGSASSVTWLFARLLYFDEVVLGKIRLPDLLSFTFCCGMIVFIFSKEKEGKESNAGKKNLISRLILTALYSTLIAYQLICSASENLEANLFIPVGFFLVVQMLLNLMITYNSLSEKKFYISATLIFLAGMFVLLLV